MTTTRQGLPGHYEAPDSAFGTEHEGMSRNAQDGDGRWESDPPHVSGAGATPGRRRRRRQRSQRGRRRLGQPRAHIEIVTREHIFQELEGLLRQIREEAEESPHWAEAEIRAMAHAVGAFTKELEEHTDPISERMRSEYQRVRDKLTHALRGERQP